jgi:general secretion pathway protein G
MRNRGFTLLELLIALSVLGLLSAIAVPLYGAIANRAAVAQATADISMLDMRLERYFSNNFDYPDSLDELGGGQLLDPWGQPYQYLKIRGNDSPGLSGQLRKDRNLVPINSDFDLYSLGADGATRPPLTAPPSRDDIVRAADGSFVGVGEDF